MLDLTISFLTDYQVDLGFIVDASSTVPSIHWHSMLSYAKAVARSFDISSSRTRVGLIVFSDYARIAFPFDADYTIDGVQKLIDSLQQQGEKEVRIDRALQAAYRDLFTTRSGARAEARQV